MAGQQSKPETTIVSASMGVAACLAFAAAVALPAPLALAQQSEDPQVQDLVDELRTELKRGEQNRLIDPWFLRDLRQALDRYDNPWDQLILEDSFSSRSGQPGSPWQVIAGEFLNDWRYGMRSLVRPVEKVAGPAESQPAQSKPASPLAQIFAALLGQSGSDSAEETGTGSSEPALDIAKTYDIAAVVAPVPIPNAFALRTEVSARSVEDVQQPRFELGIYQGQDAKAGYRLAIFPGARRSVHLQRVSRQGAAASIGVYDKPLKLLDGVAHVVEWTRASGGRMLVSVDGQQLLDVTDVTTSGTFDGFSVVNQRGDVALRSIRIDGAR